MRLKYYLRGLGLGIIISTAIWLAASAGAKKPMTDEEVIERAKELGMVEDSARLVSAIEENTESSQDIIFSTEATENEPKTELQSEEKTETGDTEPSTEDIIAKAEAESKAAAESKVATEKAKAEAESKAAAEKAKAEAESKAAAEKAKAEAESKAAAEKAKAEAESKAAAEKAKAEAESKAAAEVTSKTVLIQIRDGEGSYEIAKKLQQQGLVSDANAFDNFLCNNGYDRKLASGNHEIKMGSSNDEIAKELIKHK